MCGSVESLNSDPSGPYPMCSGREQTISKAPNMFFAVFVFVWFFLFVCFGLVFLVYALTSRVGICLSVAETKGGQSTFKSHRPIHG